MFLRTAGGCQYIWKMQKERIMTFRNISTLESSLNSCQISVRNIVTVLLFCCEGIFCSSYFHKNTTNSTNLPTLLNFLKVWQDQLFFTIAKSFKKNSSLTNANLQLFFYNFLLYVIWQVLQNKIFKVQQC